MYSVVRFSPIDDDTLRTLKQLAADALPEVRVELDRGVPDRVSIPLADDQEWDIHAMSLETNLKHFDGFLALVEEKRIRTELDIALEPEDHENILTVYAFNPQLLSLLASRGIELQVSIYGK